MATREMVSRGQGSALAFAGDDRSHGGKLQVPFRVGMPGRAPGRESARGDARRNRGLRERTLLLASRLLSLSGGLAPPPGGKSFGTADQQSRTFTLHTLVGSRLRSS